MATRKTTKSTAKSSVSKKITSRNSTQDSSFDNEAMDIPTGKSWFPKKIFLIAIIVVALILLAYKFKGLFIAAIVNGQPISRMTVIKQLEKQGGKQALNDLITQNLVMQEAEKEHITVSQNEINLEIKKLEVNLSRQGQNLNQLLAAQGLSRIDLEQRIKLQGIITKKFSKSVTVTDKEVDDYMQQNKDQIPANANMDQYKAQAKTQIQQQKMQAKVQAWIADLQKKARINYFVQY